MSGSLRKYEQIARSFKVITRIGAGLPGALSCHLTNGRVRGRVTGPNKFTSVRLKTLFQSTEKAPFLPIKFIEKGVAEGGCIHESRLLLQEMYVTGVFLFFSFFFLLLTNNSGCGVRVTFSSADEPKDLSCNKRKETQFLYLFVFCFLFFCFCLFFYCG